MAANLPKAKDPRDRFAIVQARHNGHVENDAFKSFVEDRKAWEKFVKKNGVEFMPEIESEPAVSEEQQRNLDEQAAKIRAEIERAGTPSYPAVEADLDALAQRQREAAAQTPTAEPKAEKPKVTKPSAASRLARSVKSGPTLRTPKGRVGAAIALFAVLLILVVMVGGIVVSNGNGGTLSTTRWKLAGAVLAQKAVIA